jgi:hypothetical protein
MTGGTCSAACLHMQRGSLLPQPCHAKDYGFLDRSRRRHEAGCLEPPFPSIRCFRKRSFLTLGCKTQDFGHIYAEIFNLIGVADHQAAFPAFLFQFSHN